MASGLSAGSGVIQGNDPHEFGMGVVQSAERGAGRWPGFPRCPELAAPNVAVWTGDQLIIWGGIGPANRGNVNVGCLEPARTVLTRATTA